LSGEIKRSQGSKMGKETAGTRVGVISDTHGLLRPEAIEALSGSELILHAGDIGKPEVLEALSAIAPVKVVRGNNDQGDWAEAIPLRQVIQIEKLAIYLLHDVKELDFAAEAAGFRIVISGHSHKPMVEERQGVLFLNPGSAGPRRFKLPITVAYLEIKGTEAKAEIVQLTV
jgi:putative phosphoesterase